MRPFLEIPLSNPKKFLDSIATEVKKHGGSVVFEPKSDRSEEGLLLASDTGICPFPSIIGTLPFTRESGAEALEYMRRYIVGAISEQKVEFTWRSGVIVDLDGVFWRCRVRILMKVIK